MRGVALALLLALCGCVERKLIVRSDPPGAAVYVDGALVGTTDAEGRLSVPFTTYGTRVVVARRTGCVPLRREVPLDPPWYQLPVLDLVTDLLWPGTIEDVHEVDLELTPRGEPVAAEELAAEAEHFGATEGRRP